MKTKLALALAGLTLGAPGVALATTVNFTSWTVRTTDGKRHTGIAPGSTFKHCKSKPVQRVTAIGDYHNATVGSKYQTHWYVGQLQASSSTFHWPHTHGTKHWTLFRYSGSPLPDGYTYHLYLTQSGHGIGNSWINIATKKKHGKPC